MIIVQFLFKDRNKMNLNKIEIDSAKSIENSLVLNYTL